MKLALIVPLGQAVHPVAFECLLDPMFEAYEAVVTGPPGSQLFKLTVSRGQQPQARTWLGREAIKMGAEWLLWLDDDMLIPRGAVKKMLASGKQCISGHYYSRSHSDMFGNGSYPVNAFFPKEGGGHVPVDPSINDGIHKVSAFGFGCLLMHRDVFEAVDKLATSKGSYPFVTYPGCTEDVYWCNWAAEAGIDLWLDASIRCGHLKMMVVCDQTVPPVEEQSPPPHAHVMKPREAAEAAVA